MIGCKSQHVASRNILSIDCEKIFAGQYRGRYPVRFWGLSRNASENAIYHRIEIFFMNYSKSAEGVSFTRLLLRGIFHQLAYSDLFI